MEMKQVAYLSADFSVNRTTGTRSTVLTTKVLTRNRYRKIGAREAENGKP